MKKHVTELRGPALDWAVAKCEGWELADTDKGTKNALYKWPDGSFHIRSLWKPSIDWSQAGPIIEEHWREIRLALEHALSPMWPRSICMGGSDTLVWFMRAYVLSKLGEEIDVPEELL